ncbi:hypothetical protein CHCC20335_1736 [Bacillus paralicheniformis]|nr:hypothetical protein CHCC20335_1736 [Bacillus paralicheniformis]
MIKTCQQSRWMDIHELTTLFPVHSFRPDATPLWEKRKNIEL